MSEARHRAAVTRVPSEAGGPAGSRDLLACPVCKRELRLSARQAECAACRRTFPSISEELGTFDFRCEDLLGAEREHWLELQQRGEIAYVGNREANCSRWLMGGTYAKAFGEFCRLDGLVLDIGCGPYGPYRLPGTDPGAFFVGVDPLPTAEPMPWVFRALGEYLPFADGVFDRVIMVSSLDHMVRPLAALEEARRVLARPHGCLHVWTHIEPARKLEIRRLALAAVQQFREGRSIADLISRAVAAFRRAGAVRGRSAGDDYHVQFLDREETVRLLAAAGFAVEHTLICDGHVFFFTARLSDPRSSPA